MPRDALGNVIPGSYGPDAMGIKPMNASPRAAQMLQGTARALTNPGADQRNPMATAALQRASAGVVRPPLRQGGAALAPDRAQQIQAQQAANARMMQARAAPPVANNPSDRAAQVLAMQQAAALPAPADPRAQQQADLIRQRQAMAQRPMGFGSAIRA